MNLEDLSGAMYDRDGWRVRERERERERVRKICSISETWWWWCMCHMIFWKRRPFAAGNCKRNRSSFICRILVSSKLPKKIWKFINESNWLRNGIFNTFGGKRFQKLYLAFNPSNFSRQVKYCRLQSISKLKKNLTWKCQLVNKGKNYCFWGPFFCTKKWHFFLVWVSISSHSSIRLRKM